MKTMKHHNNPHNGGFSITGVLVTAVLLGFTTAAIGQAMSGSLRLQAKWQLKERAQDSLEVIASDYNPSADWPSISRCSFRVLESNPTEEWDEVEATCTKGDYLTASATKIMEYTSGNNGNGNGNGKSNNGDGNNLEDCDPSNPANGESCENQEDVELNG